MSFFLHMKKHNKKLNNYSKITGSLEQVQNPKLCSPQMVMYPAEGPQKVGAKDSFPRNTVEVGIF